MNDGGRYDWECPPGPEDGPPEEGEPGYAEFVAACLRDCHCCRGCGRFGIPCAGVMAGGVCDAVCTCSDDYDREREDEASDG